MCFYWWYFNLLLQQLFEWSKLVQHNCGNKESLTVGENEKYNCKCVPDKSPILGGCCHVPCTIHVPFLTLSWRRHLEVFWKYSESIWIIHCEEDSWKWLCSFVKKGHKVDCEYIIMSPKTRNRNKWMEIPAQTQMNLQHYRLLILFWCWWEDIDE